MGVAASSSEQRSYLRVSVATDVSTRIQREANFTHTKCVDGSSDLHRKVIISKSAQKPRVAR